MIEWMNARYRKKRVKKKEREKGRRNRKQHSTIQLMPIFFHATQDSALTHVPNNGIQAVLSQTEGEGTHY